MACVLHRYFMFSWRNKTEFSENGPQFCQLSRLLCQTPLTPPTLSPRHHPVFCWRWGTTSHEATVFSRSLNFLPLLLCFLSIDPFSCHISNPAYPSLAQISLHFMSFPSRNPQQILPDSIPLRQVSSRAFSARAEPKDKN